MKQPHLFLTLGLAFFAIFLQTDTFAGGSACSSAQIDRTFRLPNGSLYPSGRLTLCRDAEHSPVAFRYSMYVDRMPIGYFESRRELLEAPAEKERYVVFAVEPKDVLRLTGVVVPGDKQSEMYRFDLKTRVETEVQFAAEDEPETSLPKVTPKSP